MARSCVLLYLLLVTCYGLFLACGAFVFSLLEQPYEDAVRHALVAARNRFLQEHACVSEADLEEFLVQVMEARSLGVSVLRNVSGGLQWDFVSSLFFASTTLTTTGFGHPVPISTGGKGFCLLYLTFGIPFSLCVLSVTSQNLLILVHLKPICYMQRHFGFSTDRVNWLHAIFFISFVVGLFMLIPACIFVLIEGNWTYLDSLYFCIISLTTIGFGDYVPGERSNQTFTVLYKLCITVVRRVLKISSTLVLGTINLVWLQVQFYRIKMVVFVGTCTTILPTLWEVSSSTKGPLTVDSTIDGTLPGPPFNETGIYMLKFQFKAASTHQTVTITDGYLFIGVVVIILLLETLKNIFKLDHFLRFFLISNVNAEGNQDSRRRVPYSSSPSETESIYGSVSISES